jgi:hypothetical protein
VSPQRGLAFVKRHGVVLQAARGPVPSLAEAIAGGPIRGSWWGHPKGREIFAVADAVVGSAQAEQALSPCLAPGGKRVKVGAKAGRSAHRP